MIKKLIILLSSLFVLFLLSFIAWHYLLSIYEVKYNLLFDQDKMFMNRTYCISSIGYNAFGWEIGFRNLGTNVIIENGKELVDILDSEDRNKICFRPLSSGEFSIIVNSKYSLRPSKFNFIINEK